MLWMLLASLNLAQAGDCGPGDDCDVAAEMDGVLRATDPGEAPARPAPRQDVVLPEGELTAAQLEALFEQIQETGGTVRDLFAKLADGKSRTLPGDVIRDLMKKYGVTLDFLPIDDLQSITSDGKTVTFDFDFSGTKQVTLPESTVWVLKRGKPKQVKIKETKLKVKDQVQLGISSQGLTSLRTGDIQAHGGFLVGWVNIGLSSERNPGKVATEGDYPILRTGPDGQPIKTDGKYAYQTYDDWVVISGPLGYRADVGIPSL